MRADDPENTIECGCMSGALTLAMVGALCAHNPVCAGFAILHVSNLGCSQDRPTYCLKYR